jgi:activator of HSP90 ATPase
MATRTIKQTAIIRGATPSDIYSTLMDGKRHGALSGQPAKISSRVGGKWNVGHDLEGKNVKLTKDRRIVQTWRANSWPKTNHSKVTFALTRTAGGTKITFTQTGVPSPFYKEISTGWKRYYWGPLKKQFAKAR